MVPSHFPLLVLLFLSLSSLSLSDRCHPNDKKALLQIKKDLHNPAALTSWTPKTDCCTWAAVKCDQKTNRITEFGLSGAHLNLPIPAAVGDLPYLQSLTLQHTNITGPIPRPISRLTGLKYLDLRYNRLTGPIPAFLGLLKKLTSIAFSYNGFTGSIPASLSQLPELNAIFFEQNKLTGSIPETFADFKHQYIDLYLAHNQLSGPVPKKMGQANFSTIDVTGNRLQGDISFLFGKKKTLLTGYFSKNQFEFDLSNVEFSEELLNLDLSHNKIYGSLPKDLSSTGIIVLNVSYNRLCGRIPQLRYGFQNFDSSVFSHNKCLCGKPLPECG